VILITVVGGMIVGIMAKYGTPKIKGHGIPKAMEAVLVNRSRIAPRVAILKPSSAAIAIGTGGPFGAEGPIIQTGGAIGSLGRADTSHHDSRAQSPASLRSRRRHVRHL
jgi:CIC family chloride channel protein